MREPLELSNCSCSPRTDVTPPTATTGKRCSIALLLPAPAFTPRAAAPLQLASALEPQPVRHCRCTAAATSLASSCSIVGVGFVISKFLHSMDSMLNVPFSPLRCCVSVINIGDCSFLNWTALFLRIGFISSPSTSAFFCLSTCLLTPICSNTSSLVCVPFINTLLLPKAAFSEICHTVAFQVTRALASHASFSSLLTAAFSL